MDLFSYPHAASKEYAICKNYLYLVTEHYGPLGKGFSPGGQWGLGGWVGLEGWRVGVGVGVGHKRATPAAGKSGRRCGK